MCLAPGTFITSEHPVPGISRSLVTPQKSSHTPLLPTHRQSGPRTEDLHDAMATPQSKEPPTRCVFTALLASIVTSPSVFTSLTHFLKAVIDKTL